jgi:membrane protease YdiL (CAAX protease family)
MTTSEPVPVPPEFQESQLVPAVADQPVLARDKRTGDIWLVLLIVFVPSLYYAFADLIWPHLRPVHPPVGYSSISMLVMLAGYAGLIAFLIHRSAQSFARYGLGRPRWLIDPVLAVGLALIALQLDRVVHSMLVGMIGPFGDSNWREFFPLPPQRTWEYALVGLEMMAVGFVEEFVWRSYLVTRIEEVTGSKIKAIAYTSLMFGFNHLYQGPAGVIGATIDGVMYGIIFTVTRRLWPIALAHGLYDLILSI